MYQRLEETIGEEATTTLMAYLPPVGWADVATKSDLLPFATKVELAGLESRLVSEISAQTRTVVLSVIGTNVGIAGLALALSRLL